MNGRTHEAVGVASVMIAMHGSSNKELALACAVAVYASTVPDVDLIDNRKGTGIQMLVEVIKQSAIPVLVAMYYGAEVEYVIAWLAVMVFLVLQPHRGFSHSIWSGILTGILVMNMTNKLITKAYLIAYASHLIADLLNTKKVQILYPKGFCLNVCKSGGVWDWLIGSIASLLIASNIVFRYMGIDMAIETINVLMGVIE